MPKLSETPLMIGTDINPRVDELYLRDVSAGAVAKGRTVPAFFTEAERLRRTPQTLYVNDFYPAAVTSYANGKSNKLSDFYASLGAAETDYPWIDFTEWSVQLTDEVDWLAFISASQYMFDNRKDPTADYDWGHWKLKLDGDYWVNRSIVFTCMSLYIEGTGCFANRLPIGGVTSITYNGPEGTDTNKVFLIDYYTQDDPGQRPPPPGAAPTPYPGRKIAMGGQFRMEGVHLSGRGMAGYTITKANAPAASGVGFVVGIRLRDNHFVDIRFCSFGGSLLDAFWGCSLMWCRIQFNFFYDIYRDCVSIISFPEDFSTTCWIEDNEFGYQGRYAILQNYDGAVEPSPSIRRNSCEGTSTDHYYHTHLEEWVQGVRSTICQIGGTFGNYYENRCEATVYQAGNMWGDIHLVGVSLCSLRDNRTINAVVSCFRSTQSRTTAYNDFKETYNYVDINAERNFYAPEVGDYQGASQSLSVNFDGHVQGLLVNVAGISISNGGTGNSYRSGSFIAIAPETYSGTYCTLVRAPGEGYVTMSTLGQNANLFQFNDTSSMLGPIANANYNYQTVCGDFAVGVPPVNFGTWTANTVYNDKLMATNTGVAAGAGRTSDKWVYPLTWNGCIYEASSTTGTRLSGAVEPTWPTTIGATVVDNEVTWTCVRANIFPYDASYKNAVVQFGKRIVQRNLAPPTTGRWDVGDQCHVRLPDQANPAVWVCVVAGTPGTWIPLGGEYGYVTVASLPAAVTARAGTRAIVSDSDRTHSAALGTAVVAGGTNRVPVYCTGAAWIVG
jgi:hypothetical protein